MHSTLLNFFYRQPRAGRVAFLGGDEPHFEGRVGSNFAIGTIYQRRRISTQTWIAATEQSAHPTYSVDVCLRQMDE
jgi:hypothetical protein